MTQTTKRVILFDIPKTDGYAEAEAVLRAKELIQGDALEGGRVPHLPEIITSIDGERHMARRRLVAALFRPARLAFYEHDILVKELRARLDAAIALNPDGQAARVENLPRIIRAAIVKVSASLIGLDLPTEEAVDELVQHSTNIANGRDQVWAMEPNEAAIAQAHRTWKDFCDNFYFPSRQRRIDLLAKVADGTLGDKDLPDDLITLMLKATDQDAALDDLMVYEVGLFLTASVNTTAAATPKAAEALARWIENHPEDRSKLTDEEFLRIAAQEALRLYPTVPFLVREATSDMELPSGRKMKAGDLIRADISGANRDASAFGEEPDSFNPYRTITAPRLYGLSFGAGPHLCMGREMTTGRPGTDGAIGLLVHVLKELYRRGMELDPDDPPRLVGGTSQHKYLSFCAIFKNPKGDQHV
ncbi:cytochrome P450 [Rhizobium sp. SYY.PMSO]|uniref:cytochrome P450 n=1 Tax=Rhizobium sp. SYY.PMSO TaxID=3382192 RepID=UPI00398F9C67